MCANDIPSNYQQNYLKETSASEQLPVMLIKGNQL